MQWEMKVSGRGFHSGLPHKGINALELAMEAMGEIQDMFFRDFGPNAEEAAYGY